MRVDQLTTLFYGHILREVGNPGFRGKLEQREMVVKLLTLDLGQMPPLLPKALCWAPPPPDRRTKFYARTSIRTRRDFPEARGEGLYGK